MPTGPREEGECSVLCARRARNRPLPARRPHTEVINRRSAVICAWRSETATGRPRCLSSGRHKRSVISLYFITEWLDNRSWLTTASSATGECPAAPVLVESAESALTVKFATDFPGAVVLWGENNLPRADIASSRATPNRRGPFQRIHVVSYKLCRPLPTIAPSTCCAGVGARCHGMRPAGGGRQRPPSATDRFLLRIIPGGGGTQRLARLQSEWAGPKTSSPRAPRRAPEALPSVWWTGWRRRRGSSDAPWPRRVLGRWPPPGPSAGQSPITTACQAPGVGFGAQVDAFVGLFATQDHGEGILRSLEQGRKANSPAAEVFGRRVSVRSPSRPPSFRELSGVEPTDARRTPPVGQVGVGGDHPHGEAVAAGLVAHERAFVTEGAHRRGSASS